MSASFFNEIVRLIEEEVPFALGIISGVKGSSPQKSGAKALFLEDGRIIGTLGGGCLEAEIRKRALEALRSKDPDEFDLLLDHDFGWDDGLICGGRVSGLILPNAVAAEAIWRRIAPRTETVHWGVRPDFSIELAPAPSQDNAWRYGESVSPPEQLWIAGAGHIGRAVAPLALQLDFEVHIFDDRPALAHPSYFPPEAHLHVDYWEQLLALKIRETPTLGLIVTRGHQHDALVLSHWIQQPFAFLGMIGSRRKRNVIFHELADKQIATPEQLERVACPVGLPIEAVSPQEIAVSITAQLIQDRAQRNRQLQPLPADIVSRRTSQSA